MQKFPQKCQKIAGCWESAVYGSRPPIASKPGSSPPERPSLDNTRVNHGLTQLAPVPPVQVLTSALSRSFCLERQDKVLEAVVRGQVASNHGWLVTLSRPVRSGGDKVSRQSEVGNTKRRSLNTRLSSGTSAGTFAVSAGPYRNYHAEAGTKNEPWHVFGTRSKKGLENRSSRFEPKSSWLSFSKGSDPPLIKQSNTHTVCPLCFAKYHTTSD